MMTFLPFYWPLLPFSSSCGDYLYVWQKYNSSHHKVDIEVVENKFSLQKMSENSEKMFPTAQCNVYKCFAFNLQLYEI